jgi:AraC-like DNA-binding protein/ligand-binding sensor protein
MAQPEKRAVLLSAPGSNLIQSIEREFFVEQFEKDVQFLQLVFLLVNRSFPIKNVDLVWVEHRPGGKLGLRHLGITEALASPWSRLLGCTKQNPHPVFCNIINDYGRHEAESCGISDMAAEELIRVTGKTQVYSCRFGLIDIAVPVTVRGQHIATLFTGQVLRAAQNQESFSQIARDAERLEYINLKDLEAAYWRLPVVNDADIRNTTELLEAFADHIANSWLRLSDAVQERRRKDREARLSRKEFAYHALEGGDATRAGGEEIRKLMRVIGFTLPPNRVMAVRLDAETNEQVPGLSVDLSLAMALQPIEELCEQLDNVVASYLRKTGICVFFHDWPAEHGRSNEFYTNRLAKRILYAIRERCNLQARIGVGGIKDDWCDLAQSYREACTALDGSTGVIATYQKPTGSFEELSHYSERISHLVMERQLEEAKAAIASLPNLVGQCLGPSPEDFASAGLFFSSALDSLCFTARELGCDAAAIAAVRNTATEEFGRASDPFQLNEIWLRSAGRILEAVRLLYSGKRKKIVEYACHIIEQRLENATAPQPSISAIATELRVSVSHLSRTFKRETGQTFECYLMTKRVELAKRLLLDPLHNVSQVAQRCGFSDASYFSRVFRKIASCSPSEYCKEPLRGAGQSGLRLKSQVGLARGRSRDAHA